MDHSIEEYRIFYTAASSQSITAAARQLFLSQPTVSRGILNLERKLGCALFVRSKKGVALTPEGEILYSHAARAFRHLEKAEEELENLRSFREGSLRVGASETTLHHYLLPRMSAFKAKHPGIRLKLSNGSTPAAITALQAGFLDIAVVVSPIEEGFITVPLAGLADIFLAGDRFSFLQGRRMALRELAGYPLVCLEAGTSTRAFLEDAFQQDGVALEPDIELPTTDLIVPMVAYNFGIGFAPEPFAAEALASGRVFPIKLETPLPRRQICAVWHKDHPLSLAGQEFLAGLQGCQEDSTNG